MGAAAARLFASEGAWVAVTDRDATAAEAVASGIVAQGGRGRAWRLDVADGTEIERVAGEAAIEFDRAFQPMRYPGRDHRGRRAAPGPAGRRAAHLQDHLVIGDRGVFADHRRLHDALAVGHGVDRYGRVRCGTRANPELRPSCAHCCPPECVRAVRPKSRRSCRAAS
ncbi:Rossmann-fold NAD(P)-binding domain-containing protein [Streptomyces humidus]|uniref:hypothetical protein n=1 Tax=Streptomyces humidus TaxID=52259 RepID=UPI001E302DFA|nr:hypothetical protein [Streptomyces humidus]